MKTIKLDPNNWIFRLQRFVYNYEPNEYEQDGCKLGRMLVLLPFILILAYPTIIVQKIFNDRKVETTPTIFLGVLFQVLGLILGVITLDVFSVNLETLRMINILWVIPLGVVVLVILVLFVVDILVLIVDIMNLIKTKKEKSCPRVEWENKNK